MAGIGSTLISLLTIWSFFPTWGLIVYPELTTFPDWARHISADVIPLNGTVQLLVNVTNVALNGTLH